MNPDWSIILPNLFGFIVITYLTFFYLYHLIKYKRSIIELFLIMFVGSLFSIITIIFGMNIFINPKIQLLFRVIYLSLAGIQLIFVELFLESCTHKNISKFKIIISSILLYCIFFGLWFQFFYFDFISISPNLHNFLKLQVYVSYNLLGIMIFSWSGIISFQKMYKYTKEKKALILLIGQYIIFFGFFITFFTDITIVYHDLNPFFNFMKLIGNILPAVGLLVIAIVYSRDLNYIYRLTYDHYFLYIIHKTEFVIMNINFRIHNEKVKIQEDFFAGLVSAINSAYESILHSSIKIESIESKGTSLLFENRSNFSVIIATTRITKILERGLKRFVDIYEKKYQEFLNSEDIDIIKATNFKDGIKLFFQILSLQVNPFF